MATFKKILVENKFRKNTTQRRLCFRSGWEVSFANFLDNNNNVKSWQNDFRLPYKDKYGTQKIKSYYVDFKIELTDGATILCEVKPIKSLKPRAQTRSIRFKRIHTTNYLKNLAKFETTELFCRRMGWRFFLVEKQEHRFKFYKWDVQNKTAVPI